MSGKSKSHFERNWLIIFLALYVLIMIPLPWYYSETYIPGLWGVPLFLFGWIIHGVVVLILTAIFARECMKRPEYKNFEAEKNDHEEGNLDE
ncbi:hypothetical protein [Neisseria sp. Ec49-e6-T10]|uniref:hypothetical protein n=1 Tax=Neisseria sp. Ec49-e6-T10 TaxID=3140744 RepID=UPI003EBFF521